MSKRYPRESFQGTWAPRRLHRLLQDKVISPTEFVLLQVIQSWDDEERGGCWASNRTLAVRVGVTRRWVIRVLRRLESLRLLATRHAPNERLIRVVYEQLDVCTEGVAWGPPSLQCTDVQRGWLGGHPIKNTSYSSTNLPSAGCARLGRRDLGENAMGFIEAIDDSQETTSPRTTPTKKDRHYAQRLVTIICSANRIKRSYSVASWANEFRILRGKLDYNTRIDAVLDWLEKDDNYTSQFTPRIYCARSFRDKFIALENAVVRSKSRKPEPKPVEISDIARGVVKELGCYKWPGDVRGQLEVAVQRTLDFVGGVLDELNHRHDEFYQITKRDDKGRVKRYRELPGHGIASHLAMAIGSPSRFAINWWGRVNDWLHYARGQANGKKLSDLSRLAPHWDNPRWDEWGKSAIGDRYDVKFWEVVKGWCHEG